MMGLTSETVMAAISEFELDMGGVKFWAPYWANRNDPPYSIVNPAELTQEQIRVMRGKGSPTELSEYTLKVLAGRAGLDSAEAIRAAMRDYKLGTDCSGFVYWVMESLMAGKGLHLADYLMMEARDVRGVVAANPGLNLPAGVTLEDGGPLGEICAAWGRNPSDYVRAITLTDARTSTPVMSAADIRPGDLVALHEVETDHIGIVVSGGAEVVYYSSDSLQGAVSGGVQPHRMAIIDPSKDLDEQGYNWAQYRFGGVWRSGALLAAYGE